MQVSLKLKNIIEEHLFHYKGSDIDNILESIHRESPAHAQTKIMLDSLFSQCELSPELIEYNYIGKDSEYAYVRAKQKIIKISGTGIADCINDQLFVFKTQNKEWKIWALTILEVRAI